MKKLLERRYRLRPRLPRVKKKPLREIVAEHAARILYSRRTEEYIEAKKLAAQELGVKVLPKNIDIALKLLEVALENEGEEYWERLKNMRAQALELMEILEEFNPRVVGSVWRGVVKPDSDIDIELDCEDLDSVIMKLQEKKFVVKELVKVDLPEPLREGSLVKIKTETRDGYQVEIILKEHHAYLNPSRCDIYGDLKKGLTLTELKRIMKDEPTRLFIPRRR
ncbi:MAG: hypothetical protein NZ929_06905 [Aigarchaeota archaeon]|nr:hypothetical protein [Aigarchaeota archaeon]MDW7985758.1 hypothetical protein [Nitrososphaerota archaeon]